MEDMLLLRPPPRAVLEAGPPAEVQAALAKFDKKITNSTEETDALAHSMGIDLPSESTVWKTGSTK